MTSSQEKYLPKLKKSYLEQVIPKMEEKFGYKNVHAVPRLEKVIINMGLSEARENIKAVDVASEEVASISGQKPVICRAKKSISNFKIRQGMPIGIKVTLRGDMMYEFIDRLISIAIPRIRDFKGVNPQAFDGNGNYNLGLTEQHIFMEIDLEKSDRVRGMNITIATSTDNDDEARELLELMGMPFRKDKTKKEKVETN